MSDYKTSSRQVAKNTIFLYIRMLVLLVISLFTTRFVLKILGASDYGIYNVVCGFVAMIAFLSGAMSNATQRFITFELGNRNDENLKNVFAQIMILHIVIAIFITIVAETIGLWFLNYKMNIPPDRILAANWIYQFSILSTFFTVLGIPYNAIIIAHENMKVFAYIGIIEAVMKLVICLVLLLDGVDKLIIYALMLALVSCGMRTFLSYYCNKLYNESNAKLVLDKVKIKEISLFAVWSLCGSFSTMANTQGINILVNLFYGTVVNAARGISYQIDAVLRNFIVNFQTAMNPQIVKEYAAGNYAQMHRLISLGSKLSFFSMYILSIPVIINIQYILSIWLVKVPTYTADFVKLVLINSLIVTFSGALSIAAQATGKIRNYQIITGTFLLLNLPVAYILFEFHYPPYSAVIVSIIIESLLLFVRLAFLKKMINLDFINYVKQVLIPAAICVVVTLPCYYLLSRNLQCESFFSMCFMSVIYILIGSVSVFYLGLNNIQRNWVLNIVRNKYNNLKQNIYKI